MFVFIIVYLMLTGTPRYDGQLTLDINNTTFSVISGASLEYEETGTILPLPDIKPFERVIIIPPYDICGKPMQTRLFINYQGSRFTILSEYHSLYGAKYDTNLAQSGYATFYRDKIKEGMFSFKPYFRIIDMNK